MALEQPSSTALFSDEAYLTSFGYITARNGDSLRLPLGFAIDRQADEKFRITRLRWYDGQLGSQDSVEEWLGLNCAACHTAQISYKGTILTVDGGPGMGDLQSYIEADAPVSYPFLWNISKQGKVQWNGIAENSRLALPSGNSFEYGALGRNAGEVIGV